MKKLYFLGPNGTYCEIASRKIKEKLNLDVELIPISTIAKIVELVQKEDVYAVLPIENSIEGVVRQTLDSFLLSDVFVNYQKEIEIKHCLFSKSKKESIRKIYSHPQALAQCSKYILENFDEKIELIETSSTANALEQITKKDENCGAIGILETGMKLGLNLIDVNINDNKDNKTRFVLIAKNDLKIGSKTRTSIVFNTKNKPGALLEILSIFKENDVNLIYLESRPSKKVFGEYNFFADIDKGMDEIENVLAKVSKKCTFCKILGSY